MLTACENALLLQVFGDDARGFARIGILTTTRSGGSDLAALTRARTLFLRRLRANHGRQVEMCGFLEWTTGQPRLPHLHDLVKGLDYRPDDVVHIVDKYGDKVPTLPALESEISEIWRWSTAKYQSTAAWVVGARPLYTPAGAVRYLALHHHKREQGPPPSVKYTKRFRPSRGFFERPIGELRREVRALLRDERIYSELVRVIDTPGAIPGAMLDDWIVEGRDDAIAAARHAAPEFVHVREKAVLDRASGELRYEFKEVLGLARERRR